MELDWKLLLKSLGIGVALAFASFIFGASDASFALLLGVAYLDYKIEKIRRDGRR